MQKCPVCLYQLCMILNCLLIFPGKLGVFCKEPPPYLIYAKKARIILIYYHPEAEETQR